MALPRGATGSLRPTFVSARAVALAVRRACAFALEQPMSDRPEPTVARLRYALGGDRPSQTARQAAAGRYFKDASTEAGASASRAPAYPTQPLPGATAKLQ